MNRYEIKNQTRLTLRRNKRLYLPTLVWGLILLANVVLLSIFNEGPVGLVLFLLLGFWALLSPAATIAMAFHYTYNDTNHRILWLRSLRLAVPNLLAYLRVLFTALVCLIIVAFGLALLVVPGFIFAMRLSMVMHLRATDPKMGVFASIRGSFAMTKGHTRDLWYFTLCAFGWLVLSAFFWPLYIYSLPYINTCHGTLFRVLAAMAMGEAEGARVEAEEGDPFAHSTEEATATTDTRTGGTSTLGGATGGAFGAAAGSAAIVFAAGAADGAATGSTAGAGSTPRASSSPMAGAPAGAVAGTWTCRCGHTNTGNFCTDCGAPKPAVGWICPNCGRHCDATTNFCTNCGAARDATGAATPTGEDTFRSSSPTARGTDSAFDLRSTTPSGTIDYAALTAMMTAHYTNTDPIDDDETL